jgi:hypothetical protein
LILEIRSHSERKPTNFSGIGQMDHKMTIPVL